MQNLRTIWGLDLRISFEQLDKLLLIMIKLKSAQKENPDRLAQMVEWVAVDWKVLALKGALILWELISK